MVVHAFRHLRINNFIGFKMHKVVAFENGAHLESIWLKAL